MECVYCKEEISNFHSTYPTKGVCSICQDDHMKRGIKFVFSNRENLKDFHDVTRPIIERIRKESEEKEAQEFLDGLRPFKEKPSEGVKAEIYRLSDEVEEKEAEEKEAEEKEAEEKEAEVPRHVREESSPINEQLVTDIRNQSEQIWSKVEWVSQNIPFNPNIIGPPKPEVGAKKYDQHKTDWALLPYDSLESVVEVLQFGQDKYGRNNWRKGMDWVRLWNSTSRHLNSWLEGEDRDQQSGLSHIAHAVCSLLFLQHYMNTKSGNDDREETKTNEKVD